MVAGVLKSCIETRQQMLDDVYDVPCQLIGFDVMFQVGGQL
jgi:hypothetical protein